MQVYARKLRPLLKFGLRVDINNFISLIGDILSKPKKIKCISPGVYEEYNPEEELLRKLYRL